MGAGAAPLEKGQWTWSLAATRGFGFDGGHLANHGLNEAGEVIEVPVHRHDITMDVTDWQLFVRYAFRDQWFGEVRIPYGVREQTAGVQVLLDAEGNGPTTEEFEAMIRSGRAHHRTETYSGIRDPRLLVGRQSQSVFGDGDLLLWAAGVTVPLGFTEEDPWLRGAAGLRHNHIQLGSGTVDPIISVQYVLPLSPKWSTIATTSGRFPLYENSKTFQGPIEATVSGRAVFIPDQAWSFDAGYQVSVQGYAHWDGTRDENTGILSHTLELGAARQIKGNRVRLGALYPVATQLFLADGDGFEPGPTLSFSVTRTGG